MAEKLYIYGCGGHAEVVAAAARLCGYEIAGFWEDSTERVGMDFSGSRIVRFEDIPERANVFIAFGNNAIRLQKGMVLQETFSIPTIIHPSAQIADGVKIGTGSYIGALANIDPDCAIGDFCIVNNLANMSHDSSVADGTHVGIGALLAGNVLVGECCCVGMGSRIIERKTIGCRATIGAGAVVIHDIPAYATAVGLPARVIKINNGDSPEN